MFQFSGLPLMLVSIGTMAIGLVAAPVSIVLLLVRRDAPGRRWPAAVAGGLAPLVLGAVGFLLGRERANAVLDDHALWLPVIAIVAWVAGTVVGLRRPDPAPEETAD